MYVIQSPHTNAVGQKDGKNDALNLKNMESGVFRIRLVYPKTKDHKLKESIKQ